MLPVVCGRFYVCHFFSPRFNVYQTQFSHTYQASQRHQMTYDEAGSTPSVHSQRCLLFCLCCFSFLKKQVGVLFAAFFYNLLVLILDAVV